MRQFLTAIILAGVFAQLLMAWPAAGVDLSSSQLIGEGKGQKKFNYSQTRLKAVNISAQNFIVRGIRNPNESLTLYVVSGSKFFRDGQEVSLREGKIGEEVTGIFAVFEKKATAISTTFGSPMAPADVPKKAK